MRETILILTAAVILAFIGCGGQDGKSTLESGTKAEDAADDNKENTADADDGKLAVVREETTAEVYNTVGEFVPTEEISVSAQVGGKVFKMLVEVGDEVEDNDVVAEIDREDYELQLENAKAQLAVAEAGLNGARSEYQRKEQLYKEDPPAIPKSAFELVQTQLELAEAQYNAAQVAVSMAEKQLRDTAVRAALKEAVIGGGEQHIRGIVSMRKASAGEFVGPGQELVRIIVIRPIKMRFSVPERYATDITEGSSVKARLRAYPDRVFEGSVSRIDPTVDPATRTLSLEAEFENRDEALRPGFFAECDLELAGTRTYFLVPNEALHVNDGRTEVLVVPPEGGEPARVPVTLVERLGSVSRILGPLEAGRKVRLR